MGTPTAIGIATGTDAAPARHADAVLLQLIWLASPALPVGGFSYSEGLEAAVDAGLVTDEASARDRLLDQLALVQARSELAAAASAFVAWRCGDVARAQALNAWVAVTRETAELRLQSEQLGRSLAQWLRQRHPDDARVAALDALAPAPTWPVAFALAAAATGASPRDALLAMAFGWAENQVHAAVRAVPLGQSAGQRILGALAATIPAAVDDALARSDDTRQSFAPMLAVLSARHETQYSRLFRS
ncbi:MAG: urease accessory protein UreF [Gammaproteobacteria bacterium]|uniref:urease accessory protein UreF n=1 Tax=Azohydromonas sp. TaxID=1872666 RepID=UPI002BF9BB46|nr:urease accessory UreF family protein [Azohydromonas sp.]HMM85313.1 urease accessory UreF family protein [Azohydromonas sp.]